MRANNDILRKSNGMSGSALKIIACGSMLADHIGSCIIWKLYVDACTVDGVMLLGEMLPPKAKILYLVYQFARMIGRAAFPIFGFFLVQGFMHTHSLKKYLQRLLLFAVLSEVPYDMATSGKIIDLEAQNVMWTLVLGLLCLYGLDYSKKFSNGIRQAAYAAVCVGAVMTALLIRSDTGMGLLLIMLYYFFPKKNVLFWILVIGLFVFLSFIYLPVQWMAVLGVLLTVCFCGRHGKINKYFFYGFYPVHFLLIALIQYLYLK